jgi:anti-sigma B factor antagonist
MNTTEEKQSGVVILKPEGRIDAAESPGLEELVLGVIGRGDARLVMDLGAVPYISSRGLRVVLLGAKQAAAAGGTLAVCSPQVFVRKVFQSVGLDGIIDVFNTAGEAVDALAGKQAAE